LAIFASAYFKWWGMIDLSRLPMELPLVLATYALVTFVSNVQVRSPWMLVFPLYALSQSLVMPVLGAYQYAVLARRAGRAGRDRRGRVRGEGAAARRDDRPRAGRRTRRGRARNGIRLRGERWRTGDSRERSWWPATATTGARATSTRCRRRASARGAGSGTSRTARSAT